MFICAHFILQYKGFESDGLKHWKLWLEERKTGVPTHRVRVRPQRLKQLGTGMNYILRESLDSVLEMGTSEYRQEGEGPKGKIHAASHDSRAWVLYPPQGPGF